MYRIVIAKTGGTLYKERAIITLERAIEYIKNDELVEATPSFIHLRKRILCPHERKRAERK